MEHLNRTIQAAKESLIKNNKLSYENMCVLNDAYIYGTAVPMQALVKFLRILIKIVEEGNMVEYVDCENKIRVINSDNFNEIIIELFDDEVLNMI